MSIAAGRRLETGVAESGGKRAATYRLQPPSADTIHLAGDCVIEPSSHRTTRQSLTSSHLHSRPPQPGNRRRRCTRTSRQCHRPP